MSTLVANHRKTKRPVLASSSGQVARPSRRAEVLQACRIGGGSGGEEAFASFAVALQREPVDGEGEAEEVQQLAGVPDAVACCGTGPVRNLLGRGRRVGTRVQEPGAAFAGTNGGSSMYRFPRFAALAISLGLAFPLISSGPASAATILANPSTVVAGSQVTVSGDVLANGSPGCSVPGEVTLISPAFAGLGDFAGTPATVATADATGSFSTTVTIAPSVAPGTYDITGRCGGGNLGVTGSITVVAGSVTIPPPFTG
jgi:hypothetical protein